MQQIFTEQDMKKGDEITVEGEDARHLAQVVRMRPGERLRVSHVFPDGGEGGSFICELTGAEKACIRLRVLEEVPSTELDNEIVLFQAIPKGDRMETVIEKAVELGAREIVPVEMKHCVVRLDEKKKKTRVRRYQSIAENAARQSKRSRIPRVGDVISYREALERAKTSDICLVPYECEEGMAATAEAVAKIAPGKSVSIFIGPEGGFAEEEIRAARDLGMDVISLGRRILRTDTAAIAAMTMVMLACEKRK